MLLLLLLLMMLSSSMCLRSCWRCFHRCRRRCRRCHCCCFHHQFEALFKSIRFQFVFGSPHFSSWKFFFCLRSLRLEICVGVGVNQLMPSRFAAALQTCYLVFLVVGGSSLVNTSFYLDRAIKSCRCWVFWSLRNTRSLRSVLRNWGKLQCVNP